MPPHTSESPAKKQSKWSPEEDALIIELRGSGMKWDDISKHLPGRSSISCRLHYQNYLERRSEWDEERKNKLARLYERFKPEMWAKVAEEMQVPWRAAEAMHWQLGETDMARRAGVVPFSLNITSNEPQGPQRILSPTRGHGHSQSQGSLPRDLSGLPSPRYTRLSAPMPMPMQMPMQMPPLIPPPTPTSARPMSSRRESLPPRPSFALPPDPQQHHHQQADYGYGYSYGPGPGMGGGGGGGVGLAPIQTTSLGGAPSSHRGSVSGSGGMLPSVAELTTGVSPYNTPAYSTSGPGGGGGGGGGGVPNMSSPAHTSATASPGGSGGGGPGPALLPALSPYPPLESAAGKRRASPPDVGFRETSRRRHLQYSRPEDVGGEYPRPMGLAGPGAAVPTRRGTRQ